MTNEVRSPNHIPHLPMSVLVERWSDARTRAILARHAQQGPADPQDLFAELIYGARIAREATAEQRCAVADLLRAGAAESWAQVGAPHGRH